MWYSVSHKSFIVFFSLGKGIGYINLLKDSKSLSGQNTTSMPSWLDCVWLIIIQVTRSSLLVTLFMVHEKLSFINKFDLNVATVYVLFVQPHEWNGGFFFFFFYDDWYKWYFSWLQDHSLFLFFTFYFFYLALIFFLFRMFKKKLYPNITIWLVNG